jgi:hypothetical protein
MAWWRSIVTDPPPAPPQFISSRDNEGYTRQATALIFYLLFCLGTAVLCGGILCPKFYAIYLDMWLEHTKHRRHPSLDTARDSVSSKVCNWPLLGTKSARRGGQRFRCGNCTNSRQELAIHFRLFVHFQAALTASEEGVGKKMEPDTPS